MKELVARIRNLNKTYGNHKVLNNINFDIYNKEIVGFIGKNGAGKSTTMKCMVNLVIPDSGEIAICGHDLFKNRNDALKCQSALIENPGLYYDMTGKENIRLISRLRKVSDIKVKEIVDIINLGDGLDRKVSEYSMGMKQRLGLGIALLTEPRLLILDEPTNGLDPKGIIDLRDLILSLVETYDISILFSSHILYEVDKLADRILCIDDGNLVEIDNKILNYTGYIMKTTDSEKTYSILVDSLGEDIEILDEYRVRVIIKEDIRFSNIIKNLVEKNIEILDIDKIEMDIETLYGEIFGDCDD